MTNFNQCLNGRVWESRRSLSLSLAQYPASPILKSAGGLGRAGPPRPGRGPGAAATAAARPGPAAAGSAGEPLPGQ